MYSATVKALLTGLTSCPCANKAVGKTTKEKTPNKDTFLFINSP